LGADFLRFLVVVGLLAYVFIGVSYATMGPQAFFQALAHIAAIGSMIAIVWVFLWIHRNREKIRRSEEIREQSQLVLDLPENRYMSLKIPIDLVGKRSEIFNMLRRARLYYSSGDERAALFTLHNAVASTLSLLCEAEGINWRDIGMRGMVWELKRRHWIDFSEASLFKKLQHLRNVAAHEHDRIDERVASHADMVLLFGFFEDYVQRAFKRLTDLLEMKGAGKGGLEKAG
jgi:uncharacterized protein YutE (UPF0331/DUF86 family)